MSQNIVSAIASQSNVYTIVDAEARRQIAGYLPLSGGEMAGDISCGDAVGINFNGVMLNNAEQGAGFAVYAGDDEGILDAKYQFDDLEAGRFNAQEPFENGTGVIRQGDLYAALSGLGGKVYIDDRVSGVQGYSDISVMKLWEDDYAQMVRDGTVVSNMIYVTQQSCIDAYGGKVVNVAPAVDLQDAVNLAQLNAVSANAGTITGITMNGVNKGTSGVVNLGTVLTAHQSLANYYKKTETSSAAQISTALANVGGGSRYALETAQLVADSGSLTCAVNDQTITTIQISSSDTPVVLQLPEKPAAGARDFIIRIEVSSSTAPSITFQGYGGENLQYDSENASWMVVEPGLNLISFTETK